VTSALTYLGFVLRLCGLTALADKLVARRQHIEQGRVEQNAIAQDEALANVEKSNAASAAVSGRSDDELRSDPRFRRD
jgi:hypothetical protein